MRKVAGAGLDVFENEPHTFESHCLNIQGYLFRHISALQLLKLKENIGIELAEKIIAYYNGNGKN